MDEIEAGEQVATRVNDKRSFHRHLLIFVTINVVLWAIWAVVGFAIRWPIFVTLGWGIALVGNAWAVYSAARPMTEADIQHEMHKGTDSA